MGDGREESVITAVSAEHLKARVPHYADRVWSRDSDSQEPRGGRDAARIPVHHPQVDRLRGNWARQQMTSGQSGSGAKGQAFHRKGATEVKGHGDNRTTVSPSRLQTDGFVAQRRSIRPPRSGHGRTSLSSRVAPLFPEEAALG